MKKIFTLLLLSLATAGLQAQTTLWSESFDSSATANYTVTQGGEGMDFNTSFNTTQDYFFRTSGTYFFFSGSSTTMYAGNVGDFFAAQDVDDGGWTGSANPSELTWTGINITGYTSLIFEGLFASIATGKIDAADYVVVEYNIDGAGWNKVLEFRNDGTTSNTEFLEDSDFDGIGDQHNLDSNMMNFSKSIPGAGSSLDLRITVSLNSGAEDMAWDEFKITGTMSTVYQPTINSFTPADGSTGVSNSTDLTMTLDTAVVAGAGMIHIVDNTNSMTTDIAANSADVSISGKVVTVTNLMLDYSADFTVLVDSDAFALSTGENSSGIYDSTRWNFTTKSAPLTTLSTTFDNCTAVSGYTAEFLNVSELGSQNWRCSFFGRTDSNAAYMNGYSGGVKSNIDYLISPEMESDGNNKYVHFWQQRRYSGDNQIEVIYSTDYNGQSAPSTATWNVLYSDMGTLDTNWTQVANLQISLSAGMTYHFAFRYTSDSVANQNAYQWAIDDIELSDDSVVAIKDVYTSGLSAKILGNPVKDDVLDLSIDMDKSTDMQVKLNNIMGQEVLSTNMNVASGNTTKHINVSGVAPGLYLLHLLTEEGGAVLKVYID